MSQRREALTVTACYIGLSVSACAFHPNSSPSLTLQTDVVQPTVLTDAAHPDDKPFATADRDSDCVLTTGDIHLWCKWISRYY